METGVWRHTWGRKGVVHLLNNDILPFYEQHNSKPEVVLSDNGREFCGRQDRHPYELFLQIEEIEHRKTKIRRPQSNGFLERFHRTLLDEHLRIKGREKWYDDLSEMQKDLDQYLVIYNTKRPHQGRNMNGRAPLTAFKEGLQKSYSKSKSKTSKTTKA